MQPYAALRNATRKPLSVSATLNYMAGGKPVAVSPPGLQLKPFESRQLDFQALLTSVGLGSFRGDLNLALRFTGYQGDLVLATGSVDQTGTYVFGVLPEGVAKSRSKESAFWTVAGGFDSTFTLWNPTGAAEDVRVTLYYADGSGKYKLPIHLEGQASVLVDVAQLVSAQQPDAEGHAIPATVQSGSVVVASAQGETQPMTVALSDSIFNVTTATCGKNCFVCNGISSITVTANPFACPVGETVQLTATGNWNTGATTNETVNASWSSNATAVATVQTTGQTSQGLATGVGAGAASVTALEAVCKAGRACDWKPCAVGKLSGGGTRKVQALGSFKMVVEPVPAYGEVNSVVSGQSAQINVQAMDNFGGVLNGYRGTAHFSSGDTLATLPGNYGFTAADIGAHMFNLTLRTVAGSSATREMFASVERARAYVHDQVARAAHSANLTSFRLYFLSRSAMSAW